MGHDSVEKAVATVLLVDDEIELLESASRVLARRQLDVVTAPSGERALAILARKRIDLVVLDEKMPGLSGTEVFELIGSLYPGMPVIMLTGHGSVQHAFHMSKHGVVDYVAKPCDFNDLASKIHGALQKTPEDQSAPSAVGGPIKVLLIDDEVDFLDALSRVLRRRGVGVRTARSGQAGLEVLEHHPIDVVILDLKMPGMDGLEVLRRVKATFPPCEVILLSGHPTSANTRAGLQLGAADYLVKPVDNDRLMELIGQAAEKRRAAEEHRRQALVREILERQPE